MKTRFTLVGILTLLSALPSPAATQSIDYTLNNTGLPIEYMGFGRKETYDVAIRLQSPSLVGSVITGLKVPFPVEPASVSDVKGWLSTRLVVEKVGSYRQNVPDVCQVSGKIADQCISVTFPEPYTVTEQGIYVGYSFDIDKLEAKTAEYPVAIVKGVAPEGLWVHSSRTATNWTDFQTQEGYVSALVVTLEGDFDANAASASITDDLFQVAGQPLTVNVKVANHGTEPLSSFDFSYSVGYVEQHGTCTLDSPLPAA